MNTGDIVNISDTYFVDNPSLIEVIHTRNRMYLGIIFKRYNNYYFIPLRSDPPTGHIYQRCIFPIPSSKRRSAGLDMRKALIINDLNYITVIKSPRIANSQAQKIQAHIKTIENMFKNYVNGYKKAFKKNRIERELIYKYSTLKNYHTELKLDQ